jgi:hypothetical protein
MHNTGKKKRVKLSFFFERITIPIDLRKEAAQYAFTSFFSKYANLITISSAWFWDIGYNIVERFPMFMEA